MSAGQVAIFYDHQLRKIVRVVKCDTVQGLMFHPPARNERRLLIQETVYNTLRSHEEIMDYLGLAK